MGTLIPTHSLTRAGSEKYDNSGAESLNLCWRHDTVGWVCRMGQVRYCRPMLMWIRSGSMCSSTRTTCQAISPRNTLHWSYQQSIQLQPVHHRQLFLPSPEWRKLWKLLFVILQHRLLTYLLMGNVNARTCELHDGYSCTAVTSDVNENLTCKLEVNDYHDQMSPHASIGFWKFIRFDGFDTSTSIGFYIIYRLDYCNSHLCALSSSTIQLTTHDECSSMVLQRCLSFSVLKAIFQGEPGFASTRMSPFMEDDGWRCSENWSYKTRTAPSKLSPPTNQHPTFFTGQMSFLSPNQQCQSTAGKFVTMTGWTKLNITNNAKNLLPVTY